MKLHRSLAIGFTLLCGASLPAMAQSSQNSCTRLQQLTDQNRERFNKDWVSQAENVIKPPISRDASNMPSRRRGSEAARPAGREPESVRHHAADPTTQQAQPSRTSRTAPAARSS